MNVKRYFKRDSAILRKYTKPLCINHSSIGWYYMKIGNIIEPPSNWQSMYMRHALPEVCSIVQSRATVEVPENSAGKTFHVICEVTDDGTHNLTSYRRIIFEPVQ